METCKLLFARFCTYYLVNGVLRVQRPDHGIEPVLSGVALAQIELDLEYVLAPHFLLGVCPLLMGRVLLIN